MVDSQRSWTQAAAYGMMKSVVLDVKNNNNNNNNNNKSGSKCSDEIISRDSALLHLHNPLCRFVFTVIGLNLKTR